MPLHGLYRLMVVAEEVLYMVGWRQEQGVLCLHSVAAWVAVLLLQGMNILLIWVW